MNLYHTVPDIGRGSTDPTTFHQSHSISVAPYIRLKAFKEPRTASRRRTAKWESTGENIVSIRFPTGDEQTDTVSAYDNDILELESTYQAVLDNTVAARAFTEIVNKIDWSTKSEAAFEQTLAMTIALDDLKIARLLARLGSEKYPGNPVIKRELRNLAPPKIIEINRPPKTGLADTMTWLQDHAAEYRDRWIAVLNGKLIGAAQTRKQLIEILGDNPEIADVLITRIP